MGMRGLDVWRCWDEFRWNAKKRDVLESVASAPNQAAGGVPHPAALQPPHQTLVHGTTSGHWQACNSKLPTWRHTSSCWKEWKSERSAGLTTGAEVQGAAPTCHN
jgi:hypothetical protein